MALGSGWRDLKRRQASSRRQKVYDESQEETVDCTILSQGDLRGFEGICFVGSVASCGFAWLSHNSMATCFSVLSDTTAV